MKFIMSCPALEKQLLIDKIKDSENYQETNHSYAFGVVHRFLSSLSRAKDSKFLNLLQTNFG